MLTKYNLKMPHEVYSGENALENIRTILEVNGAKKVAVFTAKDIEKVGLMDYPLEMIKAAGAEAVIFDEVPREPSYIEAQAIIDEFKKSGCDFIIA